MQKDLLELVQSLPSRTYRDSAEIAIALGEVKSNSISSKAKNLIGTREQPSKRGGKNAVEHSLSASTIAKELSGINLPKSKSEIREFVRKKSDTRIGETRKKSIMEIINKIKTQKYKNMADIEKEIGRVL